MFEGIAARRERNLTEIARARAERELYERLVSPNETTRKALEDSDESKWVLLGSQYRELPEQDSAALRDNVTLFFYRNCHARNILRLMVKYVVGRGFSVQPVSKSPALKKWIDTFWRVNRMELRKKEIVHRTMRDGECFLRFFPDKTGMLLIRFMDPARVKDPVGTRPVTVQGNLSYGVETDREDVETVLAYWFKDERVPAEDVYHLKINVDSDVKRGRSYMEPMMQDLRLYRKWLSDRMRLNMVRSAIALVKKVSGTPDQVASIVAAQKTKTAKAPDDTEYAKLPDAVSVFTTSKGVEYDLLSPNLQAADVQHDGRSIMLSISAGAGLPEYMITSDASNANFASTLVAEAPGVREFMDWQDYFGECFKEILTKVINAGIKAGEVPAKEDVEVEIEAEDPVTGEKRVATVQAQQDVSTDVEITFPELVHRDIKAETESYVLQRGQGWISDRTASARLDLDYDYERQQIEQEEEEEPEEDREDEAYLKARAAAMQAEAPEGEQEPETGPEGK